MTNRKMEYDPADEEYDQAETKYDLFLRVQWEFLIKKGVFLAAKWENGVFEVF